MREFCWLQQHLKKEERKADEKVTAFFSEASFFPSMEEVAAFLVTWRLRWQYDGVLCSPRFAATLLSSEWEILKSFLFFFFPKTRYSLWEMQQQLEMP